MSARWLLIILAACSSSSSSEPPPKPRETPAPAAAPAPPVDDRYNAGALGALNFELSAGTPAARAHWKRGLLALHSFWYDEAEREFQAAIAADRTMSMAYWAAGLTRFKLLWGDDDIGAAKQLMGSMPDVERLSPREQTWIIASLELLRDGDVRASRKRFAAAMEQVHAQFPDDESATFLALALLATTRPEDPDTVAVRKRAGALALGVYERNPNHPGAAHYLIHAYDTPELAALALPQARAYAQIAPTAFHARHMPGHIFSRLGMWKEAIASCQAAWDASTAAARRNKLSANSHDFHSLNWLVEMNFELGLRKDADRALAVFGDAVRAGLGRQQRALYAGQVASYMARTGEWSRVDELLAPLDAPAREDTAAPAGGPLELAEQLGALATRARAAAMQRDLAATRRHLAAAAAVRAKLRPFMKSMQPAAVLARSEAAAERWQRAQLARAAGDDRALLEIQRKSKADTEQEVGGESNPSAFVLNEEIGDTLMRLGRAKEAAAEYALALEKHPKRARSLLGAARAATKSGDPRAARASYEQLVALWSAADPATDGLAEARAAVAAPAP